MGDEFYVEERIMSADHISFNQSLGTGVPKTECFTEKQILTLFDLNNGSYQNSIQWDSVSTANSGLWVDWSQAVMVVPYNITLRCSADATAAGVINQFMVSLKNGSHNIIDSLVVDYGGSNVCQSNSYTNIKCTYDLLTSMSKDDLAKHGSSMLFFPDSSGSDLSAGAGSTDGQGLTNNRTNIAGTPAYSGASNLGLVPYNNGYVERLKMTGYNPLQVPGGLNGVNSNAIAADVGRHFFQSSGGAGAANVWNYTILCQIKLRDLSDFFHKMPLSKGARIRITAYLNTADVTLTYGANGGNDATQTIVQTTAPGVVQKAGRTVPFMFSSARTNNASAGTNIVGLNNATILLSSGVATSPTNWSGAFTQILTNCRIELPAYKLNPKYEEKLMAKQEYDLVYEDFQSFVVNNSGGGFPQNGVFNTILSNGIKNLRRLIMVPQINRSANQQVDPLQSVFSSCPSTTSPPGAMVNNFNVLVSGKQIYNQNILYGWQHWINEVMRTGVNGANDLGVSSGLIGQRDFETNYAYISVDLSRRLPADDNNPMSVQINGKLATSNNTDFYVFLTYARRVRLNLTNGDIKVMDTIRDPNLEE